MATQWGIASAGLISFDFANAIISTLDPQKHKVVAVAARKLASAQEFAKELGIETAHEGYEALAKDPNVEVVYVGAINPAHLAIAELMLNNGKHILVEKPLCMNVKETKKLVELARQKKLFMMEAVWSRFQPSYLRLKEEIKKGTIGEVMEVHVSFGFRIEAERISKKELGGGTVLDLGVYCINLAQFVFEEKLEKVVAAGFLNSEGTDEATAATFVYKNNKMAVLNTHSRIQLPNHGYVVGTKGTLRLENPFHCTTKLVLPDETVCDFPLPEAKLPFTFPNSAGLGFEAEHVRECLLKGLTESPSLSLDESLILAELMEDVRKQVGVVYDQDN